MTLEAYEDYPLNGLLFEDAPAPMPRLEKVATVNTPTRVDLRERCTPVENQGRIGSCAANAAVSALEFELKRAGQKVTDLSRLFVYYNARDMADRLDKSGSSYNKIFASIIAMGVCSEALWPYQKALADERPTQDAYQAAMRLKGLQVARTGFGTECREVLASGLPVVFGMHTNSRDFSQAKHTHRLAPRPNGEWGERTGGHGMLIVGYDDAEHAWLVRNSWGEGWAMGGHCWIDYDYLAHYGMGGTQGPFVMGALQDHRAYRLAGATVEDFMGAVVSRAPQTVQSFIAQSRSQIGSELDDNVESTRRGFRDRLRGPGVGGGY